MNIRTVFMYFFLTVIVIYLMLWLDNKYLCKNEQKDEQILRHSIGCGMIMWIIIVYFIHKTECEVPSVSARDINIFEKF